MVMMAIIEYIWAGTTRALIASLGVSLIEFERREREREGEKKERNWRDGRPLRKGSRIIWGQGDWWWPLGIHIASVVNQCCVCIGLLMFPNWSQLEKHFWHRSRTKELVSSSSSLVPETEIKVNGFLFCGVSAIRVTDWLSGWRVSVERMIVLKSEGADYNRD